MQSSQISLFRKQIKLLLQHQLIMRVIKGGFWVFTLRIAEQLAVLVKNLVLARILTPNEFGLMALVLIAISILDVFTITGYQQFLIYKKGTINSYLNSVWTINLIRGICLCLTLIICAPLVASFFNTPEVTILLRLTSVSFMFMGLTNPAIIIYQKELRFKKMFEYSFSGTLMDFLASIFIALVFRNIYALIAGYLTGSLIRCLMSYIICSYRPKLELKTEQIKELYAYGKWVVGTSIITYISITVPQIVVGKVIGITSLGLFAMADKLANILTREATNIISQITLPTYSMLQDNSDHVKRMFEYATYLIALITLPITLFAVVYTNDLLQILFGEKWIDASSFLVFLVIVGFLRGVFAIGGALFDGIGHPEYNFKMNLVRAMVFLSTCYFSAVRWGEIGVGGSMLLSIISIIPWWYWGISNCLCIGRREIIAVVLKPIIICMPFSIVLLLLKALHVKIFWSFGILLFIHIFSVMLSMFNNYSKKGKNEIGCD